MLKKISESNLFIKKLNDWENKNAFHVYIYQTTSLVYKCHKKHRLKTRLKLGRHSSIQT